MLKEWEEDGVVLRVVRYRIGIFKGQKAMMAVIWGRAPTIDSAEKLQYCGQKKKSFVDLQ